MSAPPPVRHLVRDLYRRILTVGRDYPKGLDWVRDKAKAEFSKNAHLNDPIDIKRAVNYGRWQVKEMQGVIYLKKYRTLRSRYGDPRGLYKG